MAYSIEATEGLEQRITLTIPAELIANNINKELIRVAKSARIDGFRKGKIPLDVVKQRFGASVLQDTLSHSMEDAFWAAITEAKVNIAGRPNIFPEEYTEERDYKFSATFEVYPEVDIKDLDKIDLNIPQVEITDADVEKMLGILRKQQGTWKNLELGAEAKLDHRLTIDFKGTIDGEAFSNGESKDFVLVTNQKRMIPGFEEGILGHKLGDDSFNINVTFPEDYQDENLKGKAAQFEITLKRIEELTLPELDEKFIHKINKTSKTVEDLKKDIRKNLERELKNMIAANEKNQVVDALLDKYKDLALPKVSVDQEISLLMEQSVQQFGGAKSLPKDFKLPRDIFIEEAEKRVRMGILLAKIILENDINATEDEVQEKISSLSLAYEHPQDFVTHYNSQSKLKNQIKESVVEENAIRFIKSKTHNTETLMSFDELAASLHR